MCPRFSSRFLRPKKSAKVPASASLQIARTHRSLPEIVAESRQMKEALRLVHRVAPSDTSVMITGESGVGKELIAQAIHRLSKRSEKPFIDLICAVLQDTLLECELFGREAGAFSGARART
ncbi:MAG: sigma 54-interacting transcriptional regulator [Pyrinomonadaceae bacterium]